MSSITYDVRGNGYAELKDEGSLTREISYRNGDECSSTAAR